MSEYFNLIKIKQQKVLCLTICALIFYQPITFCLNVILNRFVAAGFIYDTLFCYIVLLVLLLGSLYIISGRIKIDILILVGIFGLFYLGSYLLFPQNRNVMFTSLMDVMGNPLYILFVFSMSGYFFTRYVIEYDLLINYLIKSSYVVFFCSAISFFIMASEHTQPQYMVFSYNLLLAVATLIIMSFEKKSVKMFVTGICGFLLIIFAGARGPIVCVLVSVCVYTIFRDAKLYKKIILVLVLVILISIMIFWFDSILLFAKGISDSLGINSRTIDLAISGELFGDSGRTDIIKNVLDSISILGSGLYGDRMGVRGMYAHNIIVELLSQWGYLFGSIISVVIFSLTLRGVLCSDTNIRKLAIIFLSGGLVKLFFSSSYLNQEPSFWILMALGVNAIFLKRKK